MKINLDQEINAVVESAIIEAEGVMQWRLQKAREMAHYGDWSLLDLIVAQKKHAREMGNKAFEDMDKSEEEEFHFSINLTLAEIPSVRNITVGAFIARFTDEEYGRLLSSKKAGVKKYLANMQGRTYVSLDSLKVIEEVLALEGKFNLLSDAPIDSESYESRTDELLRDGDDDEAYRIMV